MTKQLIETGRAWKVQAALAVALLVAAVAAVMAIDIGRGPDASAVPAAAPYGEPAYAENFVGQEHTVTFYLAERVTCESDTDNLETDLGIDQRDCSLGDLDISVLDAGVDGSFDENVTVDTTNLLTAGTVTVRMNSTTEALYEICLKVHIRSSGSEYNFGTAQSEYNFFPVEDPCVQKRYFGGDAFGDPESETNFLDEEHVITFTLPEFWTCESDTDPVDPDASVRDCTVGDVDFSVLDGSDGVYDEDVNVDETDITQEGTVTVRFKSSTVALYEICLNVHRRSIELDIFNSEFNNFEGRSEYSYEQQDDPCVRKTYVERTIVAAEGSFLRHVDPDQGAESESGNWGGILPGIDDRDEATGALHTVCILGGSLTAADNAFIEWHIQTTAGTATVNNKQEVSGNSLPIPVGDVPCVQWRSANPGDQTIYATFDPDGPGGDPGVNIYWDGLATEGGDQPLIKEWNPIEHTIIVAVSGVVGAEGGLGENTGELDNWVAAPDGECIRDQETNPARWCGNRPNLDMNAGAPVQVLSGPWLYTTNQLLIAPRSFIDYTIGSHPGYSGALDGAKQTYRLSGTCGSLLLEEPVTGGSLGLVPGQSAVVLTSDKGVGFTVFFHNQTPNSQPPISAYNCSPGDFIQVTIETEEDVLLRSLGYDVPDEIIRFEFAPPAPVNKQPILAWAGQRIVLEHDWSVPFLSLQGFNGDTALAEVRFCPWGEIFDSVGGGAGLPQQFEEGSEFFVHYTKQAQGPGGFTATLANTEPGRLFATSQHEQSVIVSTQGPRRELGGNTDCISTAMYESQDPGEVDVTANVVAFGLGGAGGFIPLSQQVVFLVYFMKLEDVQLSIVSAANWATGNPWLRTDDATEVTVNVTAETLVRARVRGWFETSNATARPAGLDSNGNVLPAGRWVMPDDWRQLAGGNLAEQFRPNYDIMFSPLSGFDCGTDFDACDSTSAPGVADGLQQVHKPSVGPFSLVDGPNPGDSQAPYSQDSSAHRETWLHDGVIDSTDAPMPPALVTFRHSGSGFLQPMGKRSAYGLSQNPFYFIEIPAEPWISQLNADGSGYRISTWDRGFAYDLWDDVATSGPVEPFAGPDGGWRNLSVYSDNHGEAMARVFGFANLTFPGCTTDFEEAGGNVVEIVNGVFCPPGAVVGTAAVDAVADYPDKRKHFPLGSNTVDFTFTSGINKSVSVEVLPGEAPQFAYVVLHVVGFTGQCEGAVLGERVTFQIDSGSGVFIDAAGAGTFSNLFADVETFRTGAESVYPVGGLGPDGYKVLPRVVNGECQAWVRISNSLLEVTNVLVTAYDPEGTVRFDVIVDFQDTFTYNLVAGWNLIVWMGEDGISPAGALSGGDPDITDITTALYGWVAATQTWLGFFPSGVNVPGANDLTALLNGEAYWIHVTQGTAWTVPTDVGP